MGWPLMVVIGLLFAGCAVPSDTDGGGGGGGGDGDPFGSGPFTYTLEDTSGTWPDGKYRLAVYNSPTLVEESSLKAGLRKL